MIRRRDLLTGAAALTAFASLARADSITPQLGGGIGRRFDGGLGNAGKVIVVPYVGPGDLATFTAWYGLRGYNAAYSTGANAAVDLVDQAGANPITIKILSNGNLDLATLLAWVTAHSVTKILVSKIYDQTGNGNHVVQATNGARPAISLNAIGALPALSLAEANSTFLESAASISSPLSQPLSISLVLNDSSTGSNSPDIASATSGEVSVLRYFTNYSIYGGSTNGYVNPFTQNAWHCVQAVAHQSANVVNLDGATPSFTNNSTTGAGGFTGKILIGKDTFGNFSTALMAEVGILSGAMSSPIQATMLANQQAYWGVV